MTQTPLNDIVEGAKEMKRLGVSDSDIAAFFGINETCMDFCLEDSGSENSHAIADNISHPRHYLSETGLEVIDVIEAFTFDLQGIEATDTGNILKYMCRWKKKNGVEDLKKAQWYLNHLIAHVEKIEKENKQ